MSSSSTNLNTMISNSHRLDGDEDEHFSYAMQLVNSTTLSMVFNTTIELGLLEIIAKAGPGAHLSPVELASHIPTTNPEAPTMLDRILQFLVSYSVLTCSISDCDGRPQRMYGLAPVAKYFVRNEDGASFGPMIALLQDKVFIDSWYELKSAILEGGIPFNKVHGTHAFDYAGMDPRFNEVFNKAMSNQTTIITKKILESYKGFDHFRRLVDVGGGLGDSLSMITSKYPAIKGINFDLPHVIRHAPPYPGVEHLGGDMFESVPEGDAIFTKWILHDWSDDHCLKLLKNCYKALPDNGKVIVVERILPVQPDTSSVVQSICQNDMFMMTVNPGGKERTQQEFLALATGAGFAGIRMECFTCDFWVMEFYKCERA